MTRGSQTHYAFYVLYHTYLSRCLAESWQKKPLALFPVQQDCTVTFRLRERFRLTCEMYNDLATDDTHFFISKQFISNLGPGPRTRKVKQFLRPSDESCCLKIYCFDIFSLFSWQINPNAYYFQQFWAQKFGKKQESFEADADACLWCLAEKIASFMSEHSNLTGAYITTDSLI